MSVNNVFQILSWIWKQSFTNKSTNEATSVAALGIKRKTKSLNRSS